MKNDYSFSLDKDPYTYALKAFANRWKPFILQGIKTDGSVRFSTFSKIFPISERVLASNLKELERDGLITKTVYYDRTLRVEYRLTEAGEDACVILNEIYAWGRTEMIRRNMEIDKKGEVFRGYLDASVLQEIDYPSDKKDSP